MERTKWYKNAIIYQIYPRSFCDSNGDGFGDIKGITSKLDYLKELGINCVWLSPVYDSPQKDNGYDISNYQDIYPPFGNMDDFKEMLDGMHSRGIKLMMDLVVNHTSTEHPWFKEAISNPESPYRDYYIIKPGKNNGEKPPTNWTSFFGGKAWERIEGTNDYYLHLFAKEQADLNWENEELRADIIKMIRFWLDLGVDGFRCDVINLISKDQRFKDGFPTPVLCGGKSYINGPRLHEYLKLLNEHAFSHYDSATVGETVLTSLHDAKLITSEKRKELDMVFNFDHTDCDNYFGVKYFYRKFKLSRFKKRLSKFQYGLEKHGWNSLFIENHDQRRSVGRFGTTTDDLYKDLSSKMLALCYFNLKGTPFIYQGQEIGMMNIDSKDIKDYEDVEIKNIYDMTRKNFIYRLLIGRHIFDTSRDHARTPMQWDSSEYAGFSTATPWFNVNRNKDKINVESAKNDPHSLYYWYKKLIELRKTEDVLINGKYSLLRTDKNIFAYQRETDKDVALIICNFSDKTIDNKIDLNGFDIVLSNYTGVYETKLLPYDARMYIKRKPIGE